MPKIRTLVVEDSVSVRRHIVDTLAGHPEFDVIGEAEDGQRAMEMCRALRPDVVTLDIVMPQTDGVSAVEWIMAHCPTPILVVSSSVERGEVFRTYDALAAGAIDVLEKPDGTEKDGEWEGKLIEALRLVSKIRAITHPRARLSGFVPRNERRAALLSNGAPVRSYRAVAIGASAGGPAAMLEIVSALAPEFPLPILLVIHIGKIFASPMAEWLGHHTALPVRCAQDGEALPPPGQGCLLLAQPGAHLVLDEGRLRLDKGPERNYCRPSVDVLFESMAAALGELAIGCLLTGMGRDGARGLMAMRKSGSVTMAQDEASSIVFGMPKEAIELGAAGMVLPLDRIAVKLTELARSFGRQS
ncbi:MAG: chemotaxis-specific protein-glutamate methyltransferase CheB [Candidatus Wallbacteria bacterium]|nr:chemotaxis-specific protein-glutamate methyltransferase CheB [Candidatus Wallbacteria bacterium]